MLYRHKSTEVSSIPKKKEKEAGLNVNFLLRKKINSDMLIFMRRTDHPTDPPATMVDLGSESPKVFKRYSMQLHIIVQNKNINAEMKP